MEYAGSSPALPAKCIYNSKGKGKYEKNCSKLLDGGVLLGGNLLRLASYFNNSVSGIIIVVRYLCWPFAQAVKGDVMQPQDKQIGLARELMALGLTRSGPV